jgi:hypothetical protein
MAARCKWEQDSRDKVWECSFVAPYSKKEQRGELDNNRKTPTGQCTIHPKGTGKHSVYCYKTYGADSTIEKFESTVDSVAYAKKLGRAFVARKRRK